MLEDREFRQYFHDLYITFLGTNLKNSANVNPVDLVKHAEDHLKTEVAHMEQLLERYKQDNIDK